MSVILADLLSPQELKTSGLLRTVRPPNSNPDRSGSQRVQSTLPLFITNQLLDIISKPFLYAALIVLNTKSSSGIHFGPTLLLWT
ncbi:hypothetical protein MJO29_004172 [Puccinia striiformis f. sp. tritici]|nr:hypothetical protein Pst134EB_026563 [Puccinia striiformis f. sp. tritici]KAI7952637.1 hypothetical protein MJO29_008268 [Puccinia striiformis f. sp. tritici]KAI7957729.1 hypothetical protein MJO29_005946 [Puccinia striiformis f. sp. tritici]KAI7963745.1 hypothetical protein MJO29_004172 [Puccinia striiformis f. sp. tritici]